MSKKNTFKKLVAATAAAGAFAAICTAVITKFRKVRGLQAQSESAQDTDDFGLLDFSSIHNDTPREYVSISINSHNNDTPPSDAAKEDSSAAEPIMSEEDL